MTTTLAALLSARKADTAPFIETPDGEVMTYASAWAHAGRLAHAITKGGRVKPGDRVAVQVEKSASALLLYLACVRAGVIYLPLNTAYTSAELEYFIADAEPALVVVSPDRAEGHQGALGTGSWLIETLGSGDSGSLMMRAAEMPAAFPDAAAKPDDIAAILYTSGTTGRSKGAMMSHWNLASNALSLVDLWLFTAGDVLLHALPIFHTHGLFVATNVTIAAASSMLFLPKFDANEVVRLLPKATVMMGVPTFYTRLLEDTRLTCEAVAHMRLFVSGSAPLSAETHRQWSTRTGHQILERYGMTETNMLTSNPYSGARVPGSVGRTLPDVSLRIAHPETGAILAEGEVGMIEVKGPNVFRGYWRNPDKTKSEFRPDGYFITGDLGVIDRDGYVSIVGRGKDLVITGGFNVYPKEVESELDRLPGVLESAVIGVPHRDFGEGVTAVVVAQPGAKLREADLIGALKGRLAKFKLPKRVIVVDALPRNALGKVLKADLRKTYADLYAGA
jgi:malonyl-CoA/methylmalonyl-CoA synthetase